MISHSTARPSKCLSVYLTVVSPLTYPKRRVTDVCLCLPFLLDMKPLIAELFGWTRYRDPSPLAEALRLGFQPQTQAFFVIKPIHPLVIDLPAFASQQRMQTFIAVTHPCCRQVSQTHSQFRLRVSPVAIVVDRSLQLQHAASSSF